MGRMFQTKNRIVEMLKGSGRMTLSQLSEELSLAPSTVSQHLDELVKIGTITKTEDEHFRKYKYYALKEAVAVVERPVEYSHQLAIRNRLIVGIAVIAGMVAVLAFFYMHAGAQQGGTASKV